MKRVFSFTLAIIMLLTSFTALPVFAYDNADNAVSVTMHNDINGHITKEISYNNTPSAYCYNLHSQVYDATNSKTLTILEAAEFFKKCMINRDESVTMTVTTVNGYITDAEDIIYTAISEEFAKAANEGDYLYYNWSDLRYNLIKLNKSSFKMMVQVSYRTTLEQEKEVNAEIERILCDNDILSLDTFGQIEAVYNYICTNVKYDHRSSNSDMKYTCYAALLDHTAVCQGYALALYRIYKELGIDTRIITSNDHAWNIVKFGDVYYNLDATWDSDFYEIVGIYNYFMRCNDDAHFEDHEREAQFTTAEFNSRYVMSPECFDYYNYYSCDHNFDCAKVDDSLHSMSCSNCELVLYYNHNFNFSELINAPTCAKAGSEIHSCTDCMATKTVTISATGKHKCSDILTDKAGTSKNGNIASKCSVCGKVTKNTAVYKISSVKLNYSTLTYNGKARSVGVTIKDSKGNTLKKDKDYTVKWDSGRKYVGKYACKITFKGNYSGTKTLYLTIKPSATSLTKLTPKSKGFKISWKKQTTQTSGYEIQYSTDSAFKSGNNTVTASTKNTSKTISKLKSNKKYYVRIRTYKTVKINGKNTKLYSDWSKKMSVTTKK